MKIEVKVKSRSSHQKVLPGEGGPWVVYLHAVPEKGKANESLKSLLAKELKVRKSDIDIIRGERTATKLIEVKGL